MGDKTLTEFETQIRYNLDNRVDITQAQIWAWINRSYRHVSLPNVYRHHELETLATTALVTGQINYSLSAMNYLVVLGVLYYRAANTNASTARKRLELARFDELIGQVTIADGEPMRYTVHGTDLYIDRAPTAAMSGYLLQLDGIARPTELSSGGSTTVIAPVWDEAIIAGATYRGYQAIGEPELAAVWEMNFGQIVNEVLNIYNYEARDAKLPLRMQSRMSH